MWARHDLACHCGTCIPIHTCIHSGPCLLQCSLCVINIPVNCVINTSGNGTCHRDPCGPQLALTLKTVLVAVVPAVVQDGVQLVLGGTHTTGVVALQQQEQQQQQQRAKHHSDKCGRSHAPAVKSCMQEQASPYQNPCPAITVHASPSSGKCCWPTVQLGAMGAGQQSCMVNSAAMLGCAGCLVTACRADKTVNVDHH
jgi:hypothetical protein